MKPKSFQFSKHYTIEEARLLLPQIRKWFEQLDHLSHRLSLLTKRIAGRLSAGDDIGGNSVNDEVRCMSELKAILREFQQREIQIKDVERGLIDFPALREGREIFLCWEKEEEDIDHWHEIDAGFAGREPL